MNSIREDLNLSLAHSLLLNVFTVFKGTHLYVLLEGLAKKVEMRVLKAVENNTKEKLNKLEKEMKKDMDKMKRNLDKTEAGVKNSHKLIYQQYRKNGR